LGRPARHWPPAFHINDYWRLAYPALAESIGMTAPVEQAVAAVNSWAQEIDHADRKPEDARS
jgi:hypothetical protein